MATKNNSTEETQTANTEQQIVLSATDYQSLLKRLSDLEEKNNPKPKEEKPKISEEEKKEMLDNITSKLKEMEENEEPSQGFPIQYGDLAREYHTLTGKEYQRQVNKYAPK